MTAARRSGSAVTARGSVVAGVGHRPGSGRPGRGASRPVDRAESGQISTWSPSSAEPDPVLQPERGDERLRQLEPPGPVEDRELLADDVVLAGCRSAAIRRSVSVEVRPSRIATVRWTCSDTSGSWVTITIVVPSSSLTRRSSPKISCEVVVSSSPVGSSAKRTAGSLARRHGDRDPLLLAAGQPLGPVVEPLAEPDELEQQPAPARVRCRPAVEGHRQLDVLLGRQVRQEVPRGLLPDHPDDAPPVAGPLAPAHLAEVVAGDDRPPGRRRVEPAEDVQQRRLAAARRADDRDHLAVPTTRSRPCRATTSRSATL